MDWESLKAQAIPIFQEYGIPPAVGLAQMALESARGTSQRAREQKNLFGYAVYSDNAPGKTYSNPLDSIRDYARLISQDPRYQKAMEHADDPKRMIQEIKKAGYAADPDYVSSITNTPEFREYLKLETTKTKQENTQQQILGAKTNSEYNMSVAQRHRLLGQGIESPVATGQTHYSSKPKEPGLIDKFNDAFWGTTQSGEKPWLFKQLFPQAEASMRSTPYKPTSYTVKPGDTLWNIAQQYLGAGAKYPQLGYTGDPRMLPVGTALNLPPPPKPQISTQYLSNLNAPRRPVAQGPQQNYTPANANYTSTTGAASYAPPPTAPKINYTPAQQQVTKNQQQQAITSGTKPMTLQSIGQAYGGGTGLSGTLLYQ